MNRPSLLHIIERLEAFLGKLPATIQKPVMHELTPLKELFLQQRPPRFVLTGANKLPVQEVVTALFASVSLAESRDILMELFRWQPINLGGHGTIDLLDARGAGARTIPDIQEELQRQPADVFLHIMDDASLTRDPSRDTANLATFIASNSAARTDAKVIGMVIHDEAHAVRVIHNGENHPPTQANARSKLQDALQEKLEIRKHLLQIFELSFMPAGSI